MAPPRGAGDSSSAVASTGFVQGIAAQRVQIGGAIDSNTIAGRTGTQNVTREPHVSDVCTSAQMSTDASGCMQAALNAMSAAGGGVLRGGANEYYTITHNLRLPNGTALDLGHEGTVGAGGYGYSYNQSGTAGGFAKFAAQPAPGDTLTLGGTTIVFVSGAPTGNQVQLGATLAATMAAAAAFLNASTDANLAQAKYYAGPSDLDVAFKTPGPAGNAFTLAATSATAGNATFPNGVTLQHGGIPGLGGTIYLANGAQILLNGNSSAIRNGYVVRAGMVSPPAGPGQVLSEVAGFSGTGVSATTGSPNDGIADVSVSNLMVLGFTNPVVFSNISRVKLFNVMTDGTNGVEMSGMFDESYGSRVTSNNYYSGAYGGWILGIDATYRSGTAFSVHDGSSGSKFDHVFDFGHAVGQKFSNEFALECNSCAKDGAPSDAETGAWVSGNVDRFTFTNYRADVQGIGMLLQGTNGSTTIVSPQAAGNSAADIKIDGPNVSVVGGILSGVTGGPSVSLTANALNAGIVGASFGANASAVPISVDPAAKPTLCAVGNRFTAGGVADVVGLSCPSGGFGSMAGQSAAAYPTTAQAAATYQSIAHMTDGSVSPLFAAMSTYNVNGVGVNGFGLNANGGVVARVDNPGAVSGYDLLMRSQAGGTLLAAEGTNASITLQGSGLGSVKLGTSPATGDNSTAVASTGYVQAQGYAAAIAAAQGTANAAAPAVSLTNGSIVPLFPNVNLYHLSGVGVNGFDLNSNGGAVVRLDNPGALASTDLLIRPQIGSMLLAAEGSNTSIVLQPSGTGTVSAPSIKTSVSTVGSLPACNSGSEGLRASVSDALSPSPNAALAGGGAVHTGAYCNGTAWINL